MSAESVGRGDGVGASGEVRFSGGQGLRNALEVAHCALARSGQGRPHVFSANASVTIERSIDQVFAYLVDFEENLPRWAGGIVAAQRTTTGPTGVGS